MIAIQPCELLIEPQQKRRHNAAVANIGGQIVEVSRRIEQNRSDELPVDGPISGDEFSGQIDDDGNEIP